MVKEKNATLAEEDEGRKSKTRRREDSDDDTEKRRKNRKKISRRRSRPPSSELSDCSDSSESESSGSSADDDSEAEMRRKRKKKKKEKEHEKERERRRRHKETEKKKRRKKEKEEKKRKKKKKKEKPKMGAVTNSWGKYGIIRETDMWNKRPEFTAWLAEIKQVNLETLSNWEEKQMFKEFMEDHNTATFPSKKYYDLDAYHRHKFLKEMEKGSRRGLQAERIVFNDEEQRRQELLREREQKKEEEVKALKYSMQSGMAQAMKEQAQLREEMNYQYRLGNFEAAAAIQRRLDPDLPM